MSRERWRTSRPHLVLPLARLSRLQIIENSKDSHLAKRSSTKRLCKRANPDDEIQVTLMRGDEMQTITLRGVDRMTTVAKPKGI